MTILLVLRASKPPHIILPPDAGQQAEEKIRKFQDAIQNGSRDRLQLDQSELNGWLSDNLALNKRTTRDRYHRPVNREEQDASSIRDIKVELLQDRVRMYVIFDMRGIDLSLDIEGRLSTREGYLQLEPTAGKLGSLPLLAGTLKAATDRLFNSQENKEKFKLPPEIREVGIEHGSLVVTPS